MLSCSRPSPERFSSFKTETLYPLSNFPFLFPTCYEFDYSSVSYRHSTCSFMTSTLHLAWLIIHVVACFRIISLFLAVYYAIVCLFHIGFSFINGHLGCFYLWLLWIVLLSWAEVCICLCSCFPFMCVYIRSVHWLLWLCWSPFLLGTAGIAYLPPTHLMFSLSHSSTFTRGRVLGMSLGWVLWPAWKPSLSPCQ